MIKVDVHIRSLPFYSYLLNDIPCQDLHHFGSYIDGLRETEQLILVRVGDGNAAICNNSPRTLDRDAVFFTQTDRPAVFVLNHPCYGKANQERGDGGFFMMV